MNIDKTSTYRKSQENPDILRLYDDFYGEANSPDAHKLLHTHYTPTNGDVSCGTVRRNKGDSAFVTREYTICVCDSCSAKGSKELYTQFTSAIKQLKMDTFIKVKTIRLKETHPDKGIYATLNGKLIEEVVLGNVKESMHRSM